MNLGANNVNSDGSKYLISAKWTQLRTIDLCRNFTMLDKNPIGNEGCKSLSRADWPSLIMINIENSRIEGEGMMHLSRASWPCSELSG